MSEKELDSFIEKYFNNELSNCKIRDTVFFYNNQYVKVLNSKKHKFKNILSKYLYKENLQIKNLKKVSVLCENLSIEMYKITNTISVKKNNFYYGFYSADKVEGTIYQELEEDIEIYKKAFVKYLKMLKNGIYEYDFRAHNFLVTDDKKIIFIDFDECIVKKPNKKLLYKSLAQVKKNLKNECKEFNWNWEVYKKEGLAIIERELNIPKEKIEKRVRLLLVYRELMKKIRVMKRKIKFR